MSKSLQKYVSKIKNSNKQIQFPMRCNRPKTPSFSIDNTANKGSKHLNDAATLSDIDQFLYENFRSLYQKEHDDDSISRKNDAVLSSDTASFLFESPRLIDPPPPENLCGSARFFVSSGSSSSLIIDGAASTSDSSSSSSSAVEITNDSDEAEEEIAVDPTDFIALLTYSPCPYEDFRLSMQEMVEARLGHNGKVDWGFMEELLFCYLDLNNKKSYRYILRAFVDLIVVLRENEGRIPVRQQLIKGGD